jgi:hypothetical protein
MEKIVQGIPQGKYPVFELLLRGDLKGLFDYAKSMGFTAETQGYTSPCALCFHVRDWLSKNAPHAELDEEHYTASIIHK